MDFLKKSTALWALATVPIIHAHTLFTNFFVDGVGQGNGTCIRMNDNPSQASFPIPNIESNDMACGIHGMHGVSRVCPIPAGSLLTFEFRSWAADRTKPRLDSSHKGPCAVYMKKVSSAVSDTATGAGWFKIWDQGFDAASGKWCTETLIANGGLLSVNIPQGVQRGYYLLRPELLALHNAGNRDPQFYVGCAQVFVEGGGDMVPVDMVSIPGYVTYGEPAVAFNIWKQPMDLPYPIPGPRVARFEHAGAVANTVQDEGLRPDGCIMENGNWCGFEVDDYSDEAGCWAAGEQCWDQNQDCWDSAPPTGGRGCELWAQKCKALNAACKARNFNGPPNRGRYLTPERETIAPPVPRATGGGSEVFPSERSGLASVSVSRGYQGPDPVATAGPTSAGYTHEISELAPEATRAPVRVVTVYETDVETDWVTVTVRRGLRA
ncbi:lytic polysaccharide monooxygenase [Patellaria atrata CBS 101060]|uniref:AA9 family lytic polysaccharide monooxygenase n=1 Tax=Patellaria atrata CBS 101060 TaxID=1346257 RepID=A0A9P4SA95_9PEZI|nr:lytic polysaccharide monooxygenase [Patellaria atrata CBS 101060]